MSVKLLTENNLEFLSLKGGSSEFALVKIQHCWKSRVTAHIVSLLSAQEGNVLIFSLKCM